MPAAKVEAAPKEFALNTLEEAANILRNARCAIATTGAGMSVESGIPDFRSADGIWARYPPEQYATIEAFNDDPARIWKFWADLGQQFQSCEPNPGHHALAELEQAGHLRAVITQNVDNLHQRAGSRRVIEYHGNARRTQCTQCEARVEIGTNPQADSPPRCSCGGLRKLDIVLFGENIPVKPMLEADAYARTADVVLIVGTSAQVYPAAELPHIAKRNGATIIEVNTEETEFTRELTDHFLNGPCGSVLPKLTALVRSTA